MKKLYLLLVLTILSLVAYGQTSKAINVETAGTLPSLISDEEKYTIEELTLTGELNGTDFRLLRDMAGCNYLGDETSGKLKVLDISNVKIVLGGEKYIDTDHIPDLNGNFRYSVDENDVLPSYLFAGCKVSSVILPTSINKIGLSAFTNCYSLLSMNIPEGVNSIDQFAFRNCKSLTTLSFPSTVSYISPDALGGCLSMQNYFVDSNNEYFFSSSGILFNKDKSILLSYPIGRTDTEFSIPDGVISTGNGAFADSPYLVEVKIPNTLSTIGSSAFDNCKNLTSIVIPNSVTTIGNSAFAGCKNLNSITIPNSVTTIQDCAFHSTGLTSIEIPSSVTSIGSSAFRVCSSLSEIIVDSDNQYYCSSFGVLFDKDMKTLICCPAGNARTDYVIPDGVTNIAYSAFYACQKLRSITIPQSVSYIGVYAFEACQSLKYVNSYVEDPFELEEYSFCSDAFNNATLCVPIGSKSKYEATPSWTKFAKIEEGEVKEAIVDGLCYSCSIDSKTATVVDGDYSSLENVTIPTTITFEGVDYRVTAVGGSAFLFCNQLTSLVIPEGVETIGQSAFHGCSRLQRLELPSTLVSIGQLVINMCSGLVSVVSKSQTPIEIAENTFSNDYYHNSVHITGPSSAILYIPVGSKSKYEAIPGWTKFAKIEEGELKEAVVDGLNYSYSTDSKTATVISGDYSGLKSITIPASIAVDGIDYKVTAIGNNAFKECYNIKSVTINASLETIGNYAFSNIGTTNITLPSTLKNIGESAFQYCNQLTSLVIPEGVETIGNGAFSGCRRLQRLELPSTLVSIGQHVINMCSGLLSVVSKNQTPIEIAENTFPNDYFYNSDHIYGPSSATLYVPVGSKSKYEVITGWTKFAKIEEGEVKETVVGGLNYSYATGSKTAVVIFGDYSGLESITIPASITVDGVDYRVTAVCNEAFQGCSRLTSLVISEGVETIGDGAIKYCSSLKSLELPSTLVSIGGDAFSACSNLNVVISRMINPIQVEEHTFMIQKWDESSQTSTWIPSSATLYVPEGSKTKYEAIPGWTKFAKIEEGEVNVAIIDGLIFSCSTGSKTATVISGDYKGLEIVTIPASITVDGVDYKVTAIGQSAFSNCSKILRVKLSENLSEIQADAFNGCSKLTLVEMPSSVRAIGERAFYECKMLSAIISNVKEPFAINENVFALSDGFSNATIYVPEGSAGLYEASDPWNKFKEIKAIEPYVEPSTIREIPLTFEAVGRTVKVSFYNGWDILGFPLKYRIDDGPWLDGFIDEYGTPATSQFIGKKLQFKSKITNTGSRQSVRISCDNDCYIYGNILSITNGDDFATTDKSGTCGSLFYGNTHIKNHPTKGLVLPATSLEGRCYLQLFYGCTSLTAAPELPATILNVRCYQGMFSGCTGLTKAPELPAPILESYCYTGMFKGCSNINEIVCKAVDVSAENCTTGWLDGVSATGTFYKDASMTGWTEGVDGIPTGWTVNDFNTKVEKDDVVYTPNDEDHTVTVSDGGESSSEIVIQSSISINGQSYEVTAIGDCAFQNNELLVKVTIPETIASIGSKAFAGCTNLKSIYIYVKVPINLSGASASRTRGDGGSSVFSGVDTETCVLYVPAGSGEAYRSADGWKEFTNIVEMASSIGIKVAKGMTTYTSEHNLDFSSLGDDVKAYVATGYDYDKNTIWLTRVKDVPAGTPILVQAPASETPYDVPVKASSGCYYKNMLVGNLSGGEITLSATTGDMTNYYLSNGMFLTATGSNTIGNGKAYLQIPTTPPAATVGGSQAVKLNDYGFASFCGSQDLDFTDVEGLKAFAVTGYDDANGTIWLTRVNRVSARTPLLLKGGSGASYSVPSLAVGSYYANMMKGNLSGSTITIYAIDGDMTNYYLKGNQLLKATDGGNTIGNGKAYMQIPSKHVTRSMEDMIADLLMYGISEDEPEVISIPVVNARGLNGDGTTGIHSIENGESENDVYYNLQGQRVDNPTKGIYIRNGKKVVIK